MTASRKVEVCKSLISGTQRVSRTAHGVQERLIEILVDLGPETGNMHVDHVRLRIEMIFPDILQQHGSRDDLARMLHQIFEQAEFARLEVDLLPFPHDLAGEEVNFEVTDLKARADLVRIGAADQHL